MKYIKNLCHQLKQINILFEFFGDEKNTQSFGVVKTSK